MNSSPQEQSSSDPSWVVIDVETTGLSPREHRIAEVAVIVLDLAGNSLGEACTLLNPGGDLGPSEGHGIEDEHVADAPRFSEIAGWLQQWLMGKVVVGHNLLFTSAFLEEEFGRAGIEMPHVPVICTMTHAPRYLPSISGRTLEQCCAAAEIEIGEPRSAINRARAAAALFRRFLAHRTTLPSPWVDNLAKARRIPWPATPSREFALVNRPVPKKTTVARATVPVASPPTASGSAKVVAPDAAPTELAEAEESLAEVIDNAPRQPDESGPVSAYLGALDTAVSDRVLSFTEAIHLKDLAAALALYEAEQADAHRTYLRTIAATAWTDHQITDGERTDLFTVGKLLDVSEAEVEQVIAEAKPKPKPATGSAVVAPPNREAAWYPDPYGAASLRWWDGKVWTSHIHT